MAITIPALLDSQITALKTSILPKHDAGTNTESCAFPPYVLANRVADLLRLLTDLMNSGTLVATGGTTTSVTDVGAYTGVNSLVGCKVTFTGNLTPALTNVSAYVISNTANQLNFAKGAIPAAPIAGDTYQVEWAVVDKDLAMLDQGKELGGSGNAYGSGPSLINAMMVMISQLGGVVPDYMNAATAQPFGFGSPHGGDGARGHGGVFLIADALTVVRNTVANYTKPT